MSLTVNQIRTKFLEYMKEKGHAIVPSASLVPENDPTTLFTGSGMQPMLPYLLGQPHPLGVPRDTFSAELWQKLFAAKGIDAKISENPEAGMKDGEKIFYFSEKKNWWSRSGVPANMPEGEPGGPDSEMFYDFDPDLSKKVHETSIFAHEPCHVNCDCGRFLEIGNNVFMQ